MPRATRPLAKLWLLTVSVRAHAEEGFKAEEYHILTIFCPAEKIGMLTCGIEGASLYHRMELGDVVCRDSAAGTWQGRVAFCKMTYSLIRAIHMLFL